MRTSEEYRDIVIHLYEYYWASMNGRSEITLGWNTYLGFFLFSQWSRIDCNMWNVLNVQSKKKARPNFILCYRENTNRIHCYLYQTPSISLFLYLQDTVHKRSRKREMVQKIKSANYKVGNAKYYCFYHLIVTWNTVKPVLEAAI